MELDQLDPWKKKTGFFLVQQNCKFPGMTILFILTFTVDLIEKVSNSYIIKNEAMSFSNGNWQSQYVLIGESRGLIGMKQKIAAF